MTHLDDAAAVEDGVSYRLEPLHLIKGVEDGRTLDIDQTKRGYVHGVVLEVFQVERVDILETKALLIQIETMDGR